MEKMRITYNADRVKETYESIHPGHKVVGLYKCRKNAFQAVSQKPGRMVGLCGGYYVVSDVPA